MDLAEPVVGPVEDLVQPRPTFIDVAPAHDGQPDRGGLHAEPPAGGQQPVGAVRPCDGVDRRGGEFRPRLARIGYRARQEQAQLGDLIEQEEVQRVG